MRLVVEPMEIEDIAQVLEVDRESYTLPWPASAYRREVTHNHNARYLVLRQAGEPADGNAAPPAAEPRPRLPWPFFRWTQKAPDIGPGRDGYVIGYAGMWLMVDEAHITTIAVREAWRGRGLGELLLASLVEAAMDVSVDRITLEVRVSNETAQRLYRKYGFRQEGLRRRYYSDNNEDAYIMSTGSIRDPQYRERFDKLVAELGRRLGESGEAPVVAPALSWRTDAAAGEEAP